MKFKGFKQTYRFNYYIILLGVALLLLFYLYSSWIVNKNYIGIVERKSHYLGPQEPGRIKSLFVDIGDAVKKDQVVAVLDNTDLLLNLRHLQNEFGQIQRLGRAQREHLSMSVQRLRLQMENEASDLIERISLIESKNAELSGLNAEIERLEKAEKAGLGYSRDLSALIIERDAVESYLRQQREELGRLSKNMEGIRRSRRMLAQADLDSMTKSMVLEQMEHAEELRREIVLTENRIQLRTLVSPCDGYVTDLNARQGDVVQDFDSVITVEETLPKYMTVYIPEKAALKPEPGMKARIYSSRDRKFNTSGTVTFVHPGFTRAANRLSFRGEIFWARKIRVALPEEHALLPGEVVSVRIENHILPFAHNRNGARAAEKEAGASEPDKGVQQPAEMQVPKVLWEKSRFEPSGLAWIPELNRYLIASDDTGIPETATDHAPYLFLMDQDGNVDPDPVHLEGASVVNDLEAVAPAGDGTYYLVSSQNISKKEKRPGSRQQILRIRRTGGRFHADAAVPFLTVLLKSYSQEQVRGLGLGPFEKDRLPVLNIEGAACSENSLYLGLKEPVTEKGALIWKLTRIDELFNTSRLEEGQLTLFGTVDLGSAGNRCAGISDLCFDADGNLFALSTIPDAGDEDQVGGFHRIDRFPDGRLEARLLRSFPKMKPEGLCSTGPGKFVIVTDRDNETPSFIALSIEEP
ncbi:biotin/lipoyl-binding protein [bacterium]|nr:biotin/lipoyl-binding protein [bacterium]